MGKKKGLIHILVLLPLSWLFGLAAYIRNKLFDYQFLSSKEFDIPVISIGNITVGGTGKTPHIEYLVRLLKNDFEIATLSRGYKRKTKGYLLSNQSTSYEQIGDEPKQIRNKFQDIEVAVDEKRVRGIKNLLKLEKDLNVILLDDAFQHRYVSPGLSILLVDFHRPIGKDYYLPYGNLRESSLEMKRANIIIITRTPVDVKPIEQRIIEKDLKVYPYQRLYFTTIRYKEILPIFSNNNTLPQSPDILLVTGIANPKNLINYINKKYKNFKHIAFPDHYNFKKKDIDEIVSIYRKKTDNCIILTTEKDAVRFSEMTALIPEDIQNKFYYLPIEVKFLDNDSEDFNKQIINYVRTNKRHSRLHIRKGVI